MPQVLNVISPQVGDAALSCCLFMAANPGSRLTTVFADGADVMGTRREEDTEAAALIGATARHLSYWDHHFRNDRYGYTGLPDRDLPEAIAEDVLEQGQDLAADAWMIPLGLGHPDHRLAADAALIAAERMLPFRPVYVYEELPYAVEYPAQVMARKWGLAERGLALEEDHTLEWLDDCALKKAVFECYASQRDQRRRQARTALRTPERVWRLALAA